MPSEPMSGVEQVEALTRPIVGIENRTAQEVFDIMSDRFRVYCTAQNRRTHRLIADANEEQERAEMAELAPQAQAPAADVERVARIIHQCLKPQNMTNADWDNGAVLGADNGWRSAVRVAASAILAALASPSPVAEAVEVSEAWLTDLLMVYDRMCGRSDCRHTAAKLWPHIEAALRTLDAGKPAETRLISDATRRMAKTLGTEFVERAKLTPSTDDDGLAMAVEADVARLVVAARSVAWEDHDEGAIKELQQASEVFASRVPWEDEPGDDGAVGQALCKTCAEESTSIPLGPWHRGECNRCAYQTMVRLATLKARKGDAA